VDIFYPNQPSLSSLLTAGLPTHQLNVDCCALRRFLLHSLLLTTTLYRRSYYFTTPYLPLSFYILLVSPVIKLFISFIFSFIFSPHLPLRGNRRKRKRKSRSRNRNRKRNSSRRRRSNKRKRKEKDKKREDRS